MSSKIKEIIIKIISKTPLTRLSLYAVKIRKGGESFERFRILTVDISTTQRNNRILQPFQRLTSHQG